MLFLDEEKEIEAPERPAPTFLTETFSEKDTGIFGNTDDDKNNNSSNNSGE